MLLDALLIAQNYSRLVIECNRDPSIATSIPTLWELTPDETDYTIPRHGEACGLWLAEIEVRQDLIGAAAGQMNWAERIATALRDAEGALPESDQ